MLYRLNFPAAFFWGDGPLRPSSYPTSVYQALISLTPEEVAALARDVFHCSPDELDDKTVMDLILHTDTCRTLDSPIEVFIDPHGFYTLFIYYESRKE
jgi:hypothetical protein